MPPHDFEDFGCASDENFGRIKMLSFGYYTLYRQRVFARGNEEVARSPESQSRSEFVFFTSDESIEVIKVEFVFDILHQSHSSFADLRDK